VLGHLPVRLHEPHDGRLQEGIDGRVYAIQRIGAVSVGAVLLVFGLLGATSGVGLLTTHGERFLGMSSNGLLSALSLIVAAVLLGAAFRGPRTASTLMIVLGVLSSWPRRWSISRCCGRRSTCSPSG